MFTGPTAETWPYAPPMHVGAPDPALLAEGPSVWVAYRTDDDAGGTFAVVQFYSVEEHRFGPPDAGHLDEHPLYGRGLEPFAFHTVLEGLPDPYAPRRWVATFRDETLEVTAVSVTVVARGVQAASARDALRAVVPGAG